MLISLSLCLRARRVYVFVTLQIDLKCPYINRRVKQNVHNIVVVLLVIFHDIYIPGHFIS